MACKAVHDAFEARLISGFTAAPVVGINDGSDVPTDGTSFVAFQFPITNTEKMVLDRVYQESGAARFVISVERGLRENLAKGLLWADQIATLFRTRTFEGVETKAPSSGRLDDENDEGNYYVLTVIVPYTYNFRG